MAKKNPYLGSKVKKTLASQMKDPEFALAYRIEQERLRIAHQVKALREKNKLTQLQLAELIGAKQPSIARLETGAGWPRLDVLEKIAWALNTNLELRFTKRAAV